MLSRIFRCVEPAGLTLVLLKNTDGEIGLKSGDNDFFGISTSGTQRSS